MKFQYPQPQVDKISVVDEISATPKHCILVSGISVDVVDKISVVGEIIPEGLALHCFATIYC